MLNQNAKCLAILDLVEQLLYQNSILDVVDGEGDISNKTGLSVPTFARIWENLCNLKDSSIDCNVILQIQYHPQNILLLDLLIEEINTHFSHDFRFQVVFQWIKNLCGEKGNPVKSFDPIIEQNFVFFL